MKERIKIFTDGACKGNPGVGGWGALIKSSYYTKELKGYKQLTTNNRMELIAVIEGIKAIEKNATIEITTDSMYVKNGISQWIDNWRKNDWKTSAKKPVKNKELWIELDAQITKHTINWQWVKGHAGNVHNETADFLARKYIEER